ncbi:hypothetical protein M6B38_337490 [Iris pallida]|uniref:Uncharacterized protein n=1 Tax=Iris pallida TaxID=29817 RepID=A0AAX6GZC4_IRIPA|nr:hypothetical protein M6B38_337490 [Iris pallida]
MYIYEGPYTSYVYSWHDYILVLRILGLGCYIFLWWPMQVEFVISVT